MIFLINCTNIRTGGSIQVADSICGLLDRFTQHQFVVVLSSVLDGSAVRLGAYSNVVTVRHDITRHWRTLFMGRDDVLDGLVERYNIKAVLTVFGPSRWNPRVPHLSGFARAHLVLSDSPFFKQLSFKERCMNDLFYAGVKYMFARSTHYFWTENPMISDRVSKKIKGSKVYTVTNYYNQIFDYPDQWQEKVLPVFDGCTLLCVTAAYPHKNLPISIEIAKILRQNYPDFRFRFVFTIDESQFPNLEPEMKEHFVFTGKVDISECPSLYKQADIMFQPTLLECFTATYPEAMKMEVPIVTTNLEFARGLCGDAAVYYSPIDAVNAAKAIYSVATKDSLRARLVEKGREQLKKFDTYEQRANKLIHILESLVK